MVKNFYCKKCVYPSHSVNTSFDEKGVCSLCNTISKFTQISESEWKKRKEILEKILINVTKNNNSNYDVLISVSGGKDSYYQTHLICCEFRHLNLKPLLVTYGGLKIKSGIKIVLTEQQNLLGMCIWTKRRLKILQ